MSQRIATHNYSAQKEGQISFKKGDVITVLKEGKPNGWWAGKCNGEKGNFPVGYTKPVEEGASTPKTKTKAESKSSKKDKPAAESKPAKAESRSSNSSPSPAMEEVDELKRLLQEKETLLLQQTAERGKLMLEKEKLQSANEHQKKELQEKQETIDVLTTQLDELYKTLSVEKAQHRKELAEFNRKVDFAVEKRLIIEQERRGQVLMEQEKSKLAKAISDVNHKAALKTAELISQLTIKEEEVMKLTQDLEDLKKEHQLCSTLYNSKSKSQPFEESPALEQHANTQPLSASLLTSPRKDNVRGSYLDTHMRRSTMKA
eukprot:GCRY01001445.1.p1 GENE.GCRY01001445.1~~GCRY01001445.1.p1  ORF type:complete len:317 (-),score=44.74 GCRY01001445.1:994-1944(-)